MLMNSQLATCAVSTCHTRRRSTDCIRTQVTSNRRDACTAAV